MDQIDRNGSSSGFVDDTENIHSGDSTSVFCSLSLRIVEIGRDSDDSIVVMSDWTSIVKML
jgi:hypothetical protein